MYKRQQWNYPLAVAGRVVKHALRLLVARQCRNRCRPTGLQRFGLLLGLERMAVRVGKLDIDGTMQITKKRRAIELIELPGRPAHGDIGRRRELARTLITERLPEFGEARLPPGSGHYANRFRVYYTRVLLTLPELSVEALRPGLVAQFPVKIP